jgi:hypothetical protein
MLAQLTAIKEYEINRAVANCTEWMLGEESEQTNHIINMLESQAKDLIGYMNDFITLNQKVNASSNELEPEVDEQAAHETKATPKKSSAGEVFHVLHENGCIID